MLREAMQWLTDQVQKPELLCLPEGDFLTKSVVLPPAEPVAAAVQVGTLNAVVSYLEANRDWLELDRLSVLVADVDQVDVLGPLHGRHRQREHFLSAKPRGLTSIPSAWQDLESFLIWLQAECFQTGDQAKVLSFLSRLRVGSDIQRTDDGVTQRVQVKAGVAHVENAELPNPVSLAPWRTFPEIEQPVSPFVLRLQQSGDEVLAKLTDSSGGSWRVDAVSRIAQLLTASFSSRDWNIPVIW